MISVAKYFFTQRIPLLFMAVVSLFLLACQKQQQVQILQGQTMGTYWQVTLASEVSQAQKETLQRGIEAILQAVNQEMSTYIDDASIMQFNRLPAHQEFALSPELYTLIQRALEISQQSDGAYDITVGPLVELWGFGKKNVQSHPEKDAISATLKRVGADKIRLKNGTISKTQDGVWLDLSSIAKGYGVDCLANYLKKQGYPHYLVDIGGEMRISGNKFGLAWKVGIEVPDELSQEVASVLTIKDKELAVATSGNYRNYADYAGKRVVHTIDPKTGYSKTSSLLSATVLAKDAMTADGYATALMALGDEKAFAFASAHHLAVLLIFSDGDKGYRLMQTKAYQEITEN